MRLFIATDVQLDLNNIQKDLARLDAKQNFTDSYHLTYQFLGDVDDAECRRVIQALQQLKFTQVACATTKLGFFPTEQNPRVAWLGVRPEAELVKLQAQIARLTGYTDDKKFHPHITLSRIKWSRNYAEQSKKITVVEQSFDVDSVKLIQSTLTPSGPRYAVLSEIKSIL